MFCLVFVLYGMCCATQTWILHRSIKGNHKTMKTLNYFIFRWDYLHESHTFASQIVYIWRWEVYIWYLIFFFFISRRLLVYRKFLSSITKKKLIILDWVNYEPQKVMLTWLGWLHLQLEMEICFRGSYN